MKEESEKKGFFARFTENMKSKKSSCCCNIEIEEITEENTENNNVNDSSENKSCSCCK